MSGLVPDSTLEQMSGHLDALSNAVAQCRLNLENVAAADYDGENWVVLDNLRAMPQSVARVHAEAARLFVAVEEAETYAAQARMASS